VIAPAQETKHDQKPFKHNAVKARRASAKQHAKAVVSKPVVAVTKIHKEVSPLPPSRGRGHDLKPVKPVKTQKPHQNNGHHQPTAPQKPPEPKRHGKKPPVDPTVPVAPKGNGKSGR
jgi:hypothetical protein